MGIHTTNLKGIRTSIDSFGIDLSKSYLFAVNIPALFGRNVNITTMTFFCESVELPSYKLKTKQIPYNKLDINVVDGINFSDFTVNFWSDESNVLRSNLLTWASAAWDMNRQGASTPTSYKREIEVFQLDRVGNSIAKYKLFGAFPDGVNGYKLQNDGHDVVKFDTTFKYDYFTYESNRQYNSTSTMPLRNSKPIDLENQISTIGNGLRNVSNFFN
jgi:hypothetical protein